MLLNLIKPLHDVLSWRKKFILLPWMTYFFCLAPWKKIGLYLLPWTISVGPIAFHNGMSSFFMYKLSFKFKFYMFKFYKFMYIISSWLMLKNINNFHIFIGQEHLNINLALEM